CSPRPPRCAGAGSGPCGRTAMLFTPSMVEVFGDWLEREQIRGALVSARPELEGRIVPHQDRPLLRVPRQDGGVVLVAKTSDEDDPGWLVGSPHPQSPTLRGASSVEELVAQVLEALEASGGGLHPRGASPPGAGSWPVPAVRSTGSPACSSTSVSSTMPRRKEIVTATAIAAKAAATIR